MTDVAKAAGVSIATVGRVLHGNGYVSAEAKEKILAAIDALGYVPNQMARTLKQNRSGLIGSLVIGNPNDLYRRINQSVQEAAGRHGCQLLTLEGQFGNRDDETLINHMIGLRVDGLVITSHPNVSPRIFERLRGAGIAVVTVERGYAELGIDSLLVQDLTGAYDAVRQIAAKGHRRVGLIAAEPFHAVEQQRLEGYRSAVQDFSLAESDALVRLCSGYAVENGRLAMEQLLALPEPPTAVFATSDTLAAGALQTLYDRRLRVPEDISLVGYDNVLSSMLSPPLDSVALMLDDIGETVMELLTGRIAEPDRPVQVRSIRTLYVDRGTVRSV
jgi:LacI family transcriptional regulator